MPPSEAGSVVQEPKAAYLMKATRRDILVFAALAWALGRRLKLRSQAPAKPDRSAFDEVWELVETMKY